MTPSASDVLRAIVKILIHGPVVDTPQNESRTCGFKATLRLNCHPSQHSARGGIIISGRARRVGREAARVRGNGQRRLEEFNIGDQVAELSPSAFQHTRGERAAVILIVGDSYENRRPCGDQY